MQLALFESYPEFQPTPVAKEVAVCFEQETVILKDQVADQGKVVDSGEVLLGARKHLWSSFSGIMDKDYGIAGQDYKRTELPKIKYLELLDEGVSPIKLAAMCAIIDAVPRKPVVSWKREQWNENFGKVMTLLKKFMELDDSAVNAKDLLRDVIHLGCYRGLTCKVELAMELGFPAVQHMGKAEVSFANAAVPPHWYVRGANGRYNFDTKHKTRVDAVDALRADIEFSIEAELKASIKADAKGDSGTQKSSSSASKSKKREYAVHVYSSPADGIYLGWKGWAAVPPVIVGGFKTAVEASNYYRENRESVQAKLREMKKEENYWVEDLAGRIGPDLKSSRISSSDELEHFVSLRGVQWGNWVPQKERAQMLVTAYEGFADLAELLGVPAKALSFGGTLGLAFGARGHSGAAAHFEPVKFVINLTRLHGHGSMAHEMGHAIDAFLGAFAVTGALSHRSVVAYATEMKMGRQENELPGYMVAAVSNVVNAMSATNIRKLSLKLDGLRSKPYWSTTIEMFARCFESWVQYKLELGGRKNGWLVSIGDKHVDCEDYPYPTLQEMEGGLSEQFDSFMSAFVRFCEEQKIS